MSQQSSMIQNEFCRVSYDPSTPDEEVTIVLKMKRFREAAPTDDGQRRMQVAAEQMEQFFIQNGLDQIV